VPPSTLTRQISGRPVRFDAKATARPSGLSVGEVFSTRWLTVMRRRAPPCTGRPEIWRVSVDGGTPDLLTTYEFGVNNERHSPEWSPDNRRIAYHSGTSAGYQVMTLSLRDGSTQQLTSDGTNEDATWAPDGRHLAFASTRGGTQQIWVMDVESGRMRQLTRGSARSRLASWSARPAAGAEAASSPDAR
jgi:Tol biopolymer transport system component